MFSFKNKCEIIDLSKIEYYMNCIKLNIFFNILLKNA